MDKSIKEQLALFEGPDASKNVLSYIRQKGRLCATAQLKLFEFPEPEALIIAYLDQNPDHELCKKAQIKLFELKNLKKVFYHIDEYLCSEAQVLMLKHKDAEELVMIYINTEFELTKEAQMMLLQLPNPRRVLSAYGIHHLDKEVRAIAKKRNLIRPN